ncbi:hypothetical protein SDC9_181684 [bioreactor metagenome]|uniref:Uncharacterized protein n=1 Tax=bioreactor metagenome TaxID=1076179 RepID=A0A645H574_9ZZZZ
MVIVRNPLRSYHAAENHPVLEPKVFHIGFQNFLIGSPADNHQPNGGIQVLQESDNFFDVLFLGQPAQGQQDKFLFPDSVPRPQFLTHLSVIDSLEAGQIDAGGHRINRSLDIVAVQDPPNFLGGDDDCIGSFQQRL